MELADPGVRADLTEALMARYADRPVIVGPGILAARTDLVSWLREVGASVLVLTYAEGAGPKPPETDCVVVDDACETAVPELTMRMSASTFSVSIRPLSHLMVCLRDRSIAAQTSCCQLAWVA